ncbi:diguanylate cyclase [Fictibacillus nanhaiensis]|uniref:diguanylate cyclase n=1 Tax=Fictibacillus nanhaiensis TaxID=742169 RepID=UPI001C93C27D|nr:diguanylate cyclase [Fictibacillus nanhaiensis]MBY6037460.1 diguanylate cyclase [Fictibacillus nanhaiensis]
MFQRLSLPSKIIMMFTFVIVLTISSVIAYDTYSLKEAVRQTYVSQLQGITTTINGSYEESHSIEEVQLMFDYVKHREPKVQELTLHMKSSLQDEIFASTNRDLIGKPSSSDFSPSILEGKTLIAYEENSTSKEVRLVAPLIEDGNSIGAIELRLDTSSELAVVTKQIQKSIIVGLSVALLLISVLWLFIRKLLVSPLLRLRKAALSVQREEPYQNIKLNASQEINEVARSFNDMVHQLEKRYLLSITDPLTGVYNNAHFKRMLTKEMKKTRESEGEMTLLFCDVDNFKMLNDNEGHVYGDSVLKKIANILKENVRKSDLVCRYGGEEFVVILPDCGQAEGVKIAEEIRQMVAVYGSHSLLTPITISIGLAVFPKDADEEKLVYLADRAMYVAKTNGKNLVVSANELNHYKENDYNRKQLHTKWHLNAIVSLARTVEVKDSYTHSHSEMVSKYASAIASTMGLDEEEVKRISVAGLLHDVGKVGIPDTILHKEGKLTEEEYEMMKNHPELGFNILSGVEEFNEILPYVLYHHERPDGKGYPSQLKLEEIPLGARIIAVADAFHSMVSVRPYRKVPLTIEEAVAELERGSGTQFDEDVVDVFLTVVEDMKQFEVIDGVPCPEPVS